MMIRSTTLAFLIAMFSGIVYSESASAHDPFAYGGRQYYSAWAYNGESTYYYSAYYYRTYDNATSYQYHYAVYYPAQPSYVYYYNPRRRVYWGRLDLKGTEGKQYSILAEKDRKEKFDDIPESAFPPPAAMPKIPEATDDAAMMPITIVPGKDIPAGSTATPDAGKRLPAVSGD
jgi:hypothetical protein